MPDQNIPSEEELRILAAQLGCPSGEMGIEVGHQLHEINQQMTLNTFRHLEVRNGDQLLELGHGNCSHLPLLLNEVPNLKYTGLEVSDVMKVEAEKINASAVLSNSARFHHYSGETIPFEDHSFDNIMTVNTIYFWPEPLKLLNELRRVLTKGGKISIGFGQADCMKQMPVTQFGFNLFDSNKVAALFEQTGFSDITNYDYKEPVQSFGNAPTEREYSVVTASI